MVSLTLLIYALSTTLITKPTTSQQSYDYTNCTTDPQFPGTNYRCNTYRKPCGTFIVYRSQSRYEKLSSISSLFNSNQTQLLILNNLTESTSRNLPLGREILVPINCTCSGSFSHAVFTYNSSISNTYSSIACGAFEGLSKTNTLIRQNPFPVGKIPAGSEIIVPIKCACPERFDQINGVDYLLTYPIIEGDEKSLIASKFNVSEDAIWAANGLDPDSVIFPQTTLLIPIKGTPVLNFTASPYSTQSPNPRTVVTLKKIIGTRTTRTTFYIGIGAGIFTVILLLVVVASILIFRIRKRWKSFQPLSARSSQLSSLSPDFYDRMSKLKHPLFDYSVEDLKLATGDFSEDCKIGNSVFRGRINGSDSAIKQMSLGEAYRVIDILTRVNHLNIVTLQGCCYTTRPYLVFEFATNGCLRDCLSDRTVGSELTWVKRVQIAFDVAVGLHYIHYCTCPSYVHRKINSRNVLISCDWRAKIGGFELAKALSHGEKEEEDSSSNCHISRLASQKVDVFAFGVVLLELISGKEIGEGSGLKDSVGCLGEGGLEGSICVERLKGFMDPRLEGYPLGDAMCLALLAKGCVEVDPLLRPTMNDVFKTLSRIV